MIHGEIKFITAMVNQNTFLGINFCLCKTNGENSFSNLWLKQNFTKWWKYIVAAHRLRELFIDVAYDKLVEHSSK